MLIFVFFANVTQFTVKLSLQFTELLVDFSFKLDVFLYKRVIFSMKLGDGLLLLFNLAGEDMFTHLELRFNVCHSNVQITLLRLLGRR